MVADKLSWNSTIDIIFLYLSDEIYRRINGWAKYNFFNFRGVLLRSNRYNCRFDTYKYSDYNLFALMF